MKYRNAQDIFPDELLKEIQRYSAGELIYIPQVTERKTWGANSGAKTFYQQRNDEIRRKFRHEKKKLDELAKEYGLSVDTIRRIVYR